MKQDVQLFEHLFPAECLDYLFIFLVMRAEKVLPSADYQNENKCSILKGTTKITD